MRVHNVPEGEPIYGCNYCSCVFKKLGSLNGHMKRMHTNVNEVIYDQNYYLTCLSVHLLLMLQCIEIIRSMCNDIFRRIALMTILIRVIPWSLIYVQQLIVL